MLSGRVRRGDAVAGERLALNDNVVTRGADGSASRAFEYFGVGLNRTAAFVQELNADERLFSRFLVASSRLSTEPTTPAKSATETQAADPVCSYSVAMSAM